MELPPFTEFRMMVKKVNPRLLMSSLRGGWMELPPLIEFEMVVKASLCMCIDRANWTMQSIDPCAHSLVNFVLTRPREHCTDQSVSEN